MENIIKFFKETYELDSSIPMDQDDPLVISMQIEFNQLGEQELSIDHKEEIYIKTHNNKNETKIYKF